MSSSLSNATIAEALQRAKELAATAKRPADEEEDEEIHPPKRQANGLDMSGTPIATLGALPPAGMPANNDVMVEQIEVPDSTVGLIIGRGGENITTIQAQSGCRVQMAPGADALGNTRQCTLQGTKVSIDKAKSLIMEIINRAGGRPPPGRQGAGGPPVGPGAVIPGGDGRSVTAELLIPGTKCGLVIGKGGETIKMIQEKAGVKMIMIQESQESTMQPKPLRIIGDPDKVEYAKALVEEVMNSKDDGPGSRGGGGGFGGGQHEYGGGPRSIGEVIVPRSSVGVIIGKGGENIKRLAAESGAKIQFKTDEDQSAPERTAIIQGSPDQIQKATQMISDLVNKVMSGDGHNDVFYMHIPSTKTGLVIGRGGETIKQICAESGAHVELSRDPPPNSAEKIFIIKGTPQQINHAQHIIRIKVGDIPQGTPLPQNAGGGGGGGGDQFGGQMNYGGQQNWNYGGGQQQSGQADPGAAWAQYYAQAQFQQQYGFGQGAPQQPNPGAPAAQPAAQPSQASAQPTINPATGQPDYSAQWAEYYRSLGMHEQAAMIENQAKQTQQQAAVRPGAPAGYPASAAFGGQQSGAPATPGTQFAQYTAPGPGAQPGYQYPGQY